MLYHNKMSQLKDYRKQSKITEINEFEIYVKNGADDVFGDNYFGWFCVGVYFLWEGFYLPLRYLSLYIQLYI